MPTLRALLSVTDKTGITEFAQALIEAGCELISTGGTANVLRAAGLSVTDVSDVTGFPEMLDGRVKTLHPLVHGGLLGDRRLEPHREQMANHGITGIDILCVNLYAFEQTVTGEHELADAIESIDIGGPAMIRSAAKNHANVLVVVDPADYEQVAAWAQNGASAEDRLALAAKAFRHTAYYDSVISRYLSRAAGVDLLDSETLTMGWRTTGRLRYGENPHQAATVLIDPLATDGIPRATQLWGKELSYNNILDADAAWELVCDLPSASCAIIKHGNPCGAATGGTAAENYVQAKASDPISAFGGIAAFHGVVDEAAALAMTDKGNFLEVVIATEFTDEARRQFAERSGWGQDVRLLQATASPSRSDLTIRGLRGGGLAQTGDEDPETDWKVVTRRVPTDAEMAALRLAWKIVPHVKSNAIVIASDSALLGVGAGQMNRVQSVRLALAQAGEGAQGAALASDAFFPFPDSIETAAAAGIRAVVQPGGSKKDGDVIARCDELGVAMVLTGTRHFRH